MPACDLTAEDAATAEKRRAKVKRSLRPLRSPRWERGSGLCLDVSCLPLGKVHQLWYTVSVDDEARLRVLFYRTMAGNEPVREWLKALAPEDRKTIGDDPKTAQFGWPLGVPLIRKLETGLWEVRSRLRDRMARVIFTVEGDTMVLLHGFTKKSQKTPLQDLQLARQRLQSLHEE